MAIGALAETPQSTKTTSTSAKPKKTEATKTTVPVVKPKKTKELEDVEFREFNPDKESKEHYRRAQVEFNYKKDLKSGKLEYVPATKLLGFTIKEQHYIYHTDPGETLGDIKGRYRLPAGSLRSQSMGGGGDFDRHIAPKEVHFKETELEAGMGKKIYHQND